MGLLATFIAAKAISADKVIAPRDMPEVSFFKALTPKNSARCLIQIAPAEKAPCKKVYGLERDHKGRLRLASRINRPASDEKKKGEDQAKSKEAAGKDQNDKKDAKQNDKPEKAKDGKQDKAKDDNKQEKSKDENSKDESQDDSGWTDEQDKKMVELKQNDPTMPWAKVGEQVGHTAAQCKDRMKELKLRDAGDEAEVKKDDKKEDDKKSTHSKASKANDNKQKEKDAKIENKKHEKDGKKAASQAGCDKEPRYTAAQWRAMKDDQIFSLDEQQFLVDLMKKDSEQSWLRLASRFHDATGRRVHPEDIREKMHQIYD